MTALEHRQEAILAQLAGLKNQIAALRAQLKQPSVLSVTEGTDVSVSRPCSILQVCFHLNRRSKRLIYICVHYIVSVHDFCFQNGVIHDIVINASPQYPPYSLAALQRLWGDGLKLGVHCHTHSSILQLPENLDSFLSAVSSESVEDRLPLLNITLVWKDGKYYLSQF
jgi:hypothetical protein